MSSEIELWAGPVGEIISDAEVVDGEVVEEAGAIEWEAYRHPDSMALYIRFKIPERWYQRTDRAAWDRLNALVQEFKNLNRLMR